MADTIYRADAITAIKGLYNVLGVAGTKAAVMVLDGLPAADAVPGRWISVKDRLPEPFETVLVQMPLENPLPTVGWGFIKGDGEWYCNHFNRDKDEVTHWMPLPEPPEEE